MSEVVSGAPATAPTPAPEASPAPAKAPKASRADFINSINAKLGIGKQPIAVADVPAPETPAEAAPEAESTSETAPEVADPAPVDPPKEEKVHAHKLAALQLEAQRAKSDSLKAKDTLKARDTEVADLKKQLELLKDPKAALKHAGTDVRKFAQDLIDQKISIEDAEKQAERDPEVQALLDEAKAAREKASKESERAQAQAIRQANVDLVKGAMDADFAEKFPLVAAMPDGAQTMLTWIETGIQATGKEPDFEVVAKMVQDEALKDAMAYLKHPGARKALLADPELAKFLRAVEEAAPAPAAAAKPTLTTPKAAQAPKTEETPEEPRKSESPLVTAARVRAKTLTKAIGNSVPSRTEKGGSSADLAARLNRDVLGRST